MRFVWITLRILAITCFLLGAIFKFQGWPYGRALSWGGIIAVAVSFIVPKVLSKKDKTAE